MIKDDTANMRAKALEKTCIKVRCVQTQEFFESMADAATWAGVATSNISFSIKNKGTAGGYRWEVID